MTSLVPLCRSFTTYCAASFNLSIVRPLTAREMRREARSWKGLLRSIHLALNVRIIMRYFENCFHHFDRAPFFSWRYSIQHLQCHYLAFGTARAIKIFRAMLPFKRYLEMLTSSLLFPFLSSFHPPLSYTVASFLVTASTPSPVHSASL